MSSEAPWRLQLTGPARRDLEELPEKAAPAVVETLRALAERPRTLGKPLRFELEGRWVARRGPYRIIFALDDARRVVFVIRIAHRADIYRRR